MKLKLIILGGIVFLSTYCIKLQFDILQLRKQQRVLLNNNKENFDRAEAFQNQVESYRSLLKELATKIGHDCPDLHIGPIHPPELRAPSIGSPDRQLPGIEIDSSEPAPNQEYLIDGKTPRI